MNFRQLIMKYFSGNLPIKNLSEAGIVGLEEGYDSLSLSILAGLSKTENSFEIEKYFKSALNELEILIPDERTACIGYALAISDEIIDGKKELINGVSEIYHNAIK